MPVSSLRVWMDEWKASRTLKTVPTRVLMAWRKSAYGCGGWYDPTDSPASLLRGMADTMVDIESIKSELATREHIPNKPEGKALRRAAARKSR